MERGYWRTHGITGQWDEDGTFGFCSPVLPRQSDAQASGTTTQAISDPGQHRAQANRVYEDVRTYSDMIRPDWTTRVKWAMLT